MRLTRRLIGFLAFCWLVAVVCFCLSFWQVQRGQEKRELLSAIEQGLSQAAVGFEDNLHKEWVPIEVEGVFSDRQEEVFLLLNRVRDGEVGYGLLRILHVRGEERGGGSVLVDLGWVPLDYEVSDSGDVRVSGIVRYAGDKGVFVPDNDVGKGLWYYIDLRQMEEVSGVGLGGLGGGFYISVDRDFWRAIPNNHRGYSLTWLGLGLVFLVLSVACTMTKRKK